MTVRRVLLEGGGGPAPTMEIGPDFGNPPEMSMRLAAEVDMAMAATVDTINMSASLGTVGTGMTVDTITAAPTQLAYATSVRRWANATVSNGPAAWTNPANAHGVQNDVDATRAGQLSSSTDAQLVLGFADFNGGIETLTISQVFLTFYTGQSGTVAGNGGLSWWYRIGAGAWTQLGAEQTGNFDETTDGGDFHNLTAAIAGSWTNLSNLDVRVWANLGIGTNLVACQCDAVLLTVAAAKTVTP